MIEKKSKAFSVVSIGIKYDAFAQPIEDCWVCVVETRGGYVWQITHRGEKPTVQDVCDWWRFERNKFDKKFN